MNPIDRADLARALEPRETTEAESLEITRALRHEEATIRAADADRRNWARPVWRGWWILGRLLLAPGRLTRALQAPPDQC
ncbi:MAG TPA: hypothetical protein VHB77_15475 [Planctomycetaceae bacterium]|nr:hypothetical protein [Planctomycetaceae bacterium]